MSNPSLYNALGGSQPSAEQQPSAVAPAGSPAVGAASLPALFAALQAQSPQGSQPLNMGPMVAANNPIPEAVQKNIPQDFGQKAPAPRSLGRISEQPGDHQKATDVMNAYEEKNRAAHPEWYK